MELTVLDFIAVVQEWVLTEINHISPAFEGRVTNGDQSAARFLAED